MKLRELQEMWALDSKIDRSEIAEASSIALQLHSKYHNLLSNERVAIIRAKQKLKKLELVKYTFYTQGPSKEQIEQGWKLPAKGVIIKSEVHRYMEADDDIADASFEIGYQVEKIDFLLSILKALDSRSFTISTIQKDILFKAGNG